ncbi:DUF547 domain-containing protein [uncultured Lacinutrix sp.]|uniref:DUF547 domain-containing protein n=1 Tax=uncultured Lacinutrix sp. TaxID=574032 RepID=UPI002615BA97|nr:DUF547 domain-containing protein [uncultured Lacinutrix sp.]
MKRVALILTMIFFGSFLGEAQNLESFFKQSDAFFKTNVANGKVAYANIKKDTKALEDVLKIAEGIKVSKSDANNYQAFWINAYNLSVIKGIIDHYPTKSPLNHKGFFDGTKHSLGGKKITLNDIEHKLLRAQFKDARFHFVLVCGAIGCPPLINKAYLPSTLDAQLEKQTKLALNGNYFIKVNTKKKRIQGSEILKWYKEDFTMNGTTEIDFINKYRTEKVPAKSKLSYFPYNWNVNKQ